MKKILFLALILMGCENFPTLSFDLDNEFTFNIDKTGLQYEGSRVVDPTTNAQFEKYKKKLNSIVITRVTYTVTNFKGTPTQTASMSFDVSDSNGGGKATIGSYSNVNLSSLVDKETDMVLNQAGAATLAGYMLTSPNKFNVSYVGSVNQSPVKFDVKIKFYYTAKTRLIGSNS
ncbi:MAG: hypothetical protein CFE22_15245 [Cytophagaceae bacterium BCCC1]|nr:MAG: hypothetical protein CFE22_15245 [Cytophagaceae bacterium BCCC1]